MKENRCNLCGGARYTLMHRAPKKPRQAAPAETYRISESHLEKPDKVVRCMTCGLVYAISKEPTSDIVADYVDMEDLEYLKEEAGRRAQARIVLSKIRKFKNHGRMLDIGGGPAFFLDEAKRQGWEVQGVDLSRWAKEYSKKNFDIDIFQGALQGATFPDRSFDAVVMNDVIEHLEDPKGALKEIRRILKNDGVLYLSTPDIDSILSRLLRAKWWGINKYHLFYFSKKTLEIMFEEVGFKSLRYSSYPRVFSLGYWATRLRSYPRFVSLPFEVLSKLFGQKLLKVVLHDQLGVVAKKIQRLDSVIVEDKRPDAPPTKKKTIVVLPAYNAARTLERTVSDIPKDVVDEIILVDDCSKDDTVQIAKKLGLTVYRHKKNTGYGGNQKTCYTKALEHGADIVVMCHPDYQYDPKIIPQLIAAIVRGEADAVFGSRMMKGGALEGGMPLWKHNANILLTAFENVMLGTYLTEFHSGFRAYSARLLRKVRFERNSDGFIFDTEIIVQSLVHHFKIDEVPIRTRYFEEASSIRLWPSILYGLGIIRTMLAYVLHSRGWLKIRKFESKS